MSADIESIKFTIEHVIESSGYTKEELTKLLTAVSEFCDAKIAGISDDESESESESVYDSGDDENEDESVASEDDYPFTSWPAYSMALTESLQTEFYGERYPKYEKAMDSAGIDDYSIVVDLVELHHENPQVILDELIDIMCNDGNRYSVEMIEDGNCDIIDYLLAKGAVMTSDTLLEWNMEHFESDIAGNYIRASLIDYYFPKLGLTADHFKDIEAIDCDSDEVYVDEKYNMDDPDVYEKVINGDLKFKSKFLSGL